MRRPEQRTPAAAEHIDASVLWRGLQKFVETLPQIVWRTTPEGLNDYFNAAWYDYTGLPPEECSGEHWMAPLHPDDRPRAAAAWEAAVREEAPYDLEYRVRRRDGIYRWFLTRAAPLRDPAGRILRWYGTSTDIDAQKQIETQFRAIADAIPQMVWTALPDGALDYVNERIYDYAGTTRGDLRGFSWEAVVHADDLPIMLSAWQRAVENGEPYEVEARLQRADDTFRWFMVRANAVRDPQTGAVTRWFGTCTDIDELRGAAARNAFLARADELFAAELDQDAVLRAVARAAVASFADYVLFDIAGLDGKLRRAAVEHRDQRRRAPFQRSVGEEPPVDHPVHPIGVAWRSGESVLVPRIDATWWKRAAANEAHLTRMRVENLSSLITVVIGARDRRHGVMTFCRTGRSQGYGDADLATAEDLGRRIGAALENAHLYQEARAAIEVQRRIAEREAFYARLGEALNETIDLRQTLEAATRLLVPSFADWAVVNLIDEHDRLYLAASHHADPESDARTHKLIEMRYLAGEAERGSPAVVRTKRPIVYETIPEGGLGAVTPPYRSIVASLGIVSTAIVPITFRGAARGTIALVYDRTSGRHYGQDDLPFFVEVGRRLSPAIGNAELYERERRIARTFQAAALTTELPRIAGTAFDALYEAGRSDALIGGDWYDAFRVADGRVVVSVGDVAGSGLDAAATMAAIRQSLRGAAAINPDPSVMLDAADRVLRSQVPDTFVTAWVGVIDPVWATLASAGAGHPPPLKKTNGAIDPLPAGGLPLGLRERGADVTRHLDLASETMLLLYTDGLIEATHDLIAGEEAVTEAFREVEFDAAPARAIHQTVLHGGGASDDVALLVVSFRRSLLEIGGDRGALQWTFDVDHADAAGAARREMVAALAERGVGLADRTTAELVFAELIGNTKRYAPGIVDVALDLSGEYGVLHVVDVGAGFQHNARLPADALAESGRGLFIVSTIAEEFAVTNGPGGGAHARAVLKGRLL